MFSWASKKITSRRELLETQLQECKISLLNLERSRGIIDKEETRPQSKGNSPALKSTESSPNYLDILRKKIKELETAIREEDFQGDNIDKYSDSLGDMSPRSGESNPPYKSTELKL